MFDPNANRFDDPVDQFNRPPRRSGSPMAIAALTCAVLGLLTIFTGFCSLILGSLAVLFAFLARGSRVKAERPANYAFVIGIIVVVISIALIVFSLAFMIAQYGSIENFYQSYLYTLEQNYGEDFTQQLEQYLNSSGSSQAL